MTGFYRNSEQHTFLLQISHIRQSSGWNGTKIMVVQLLSFGRSVAQQSSSGHDQIGTRIGQGTVHQKVFLFPTQSGGHFFHVFVEIFTYFRGCLVYGRKSSQKRNFVIQSFSCIGNKNRRNTQSGSVYECRRCGIPSGVTSCLKSISNSSVRETGRIGLLLHQLSATKFLYRIAAVIRSFKESIVFFGSGSRKGLKPVGIMGHAFG